MTHHASSRTPYPPITRNRRNNKKMRLISQYEPVRYFTTLNAPRMGKDTITVSSDSLAEFNKLPDKLNRYLVFDAHCQYFLIPRDEWLQLQNLMPPFTEIPKELYRLHRCLIGMAGGFCHDNEEQRTRDNCINYWKRQYMKWQLDQGVDL